MAQQHFSAIDTSALHLVRTTALTRLRETIPLYVDLCLPEPTERDDFVDTLIAQRERELLTLLSLVRETTEMIHAAEDKNYSPRR